MLETTKIKMGVYKIGANVRVIGEMDLISQERRNRAEAIYLTSISVLKDPGEDFDEAFFNQWKKSLTQAFKDHNVDFKTKNREDADKFIEFNTKNWEVVQELVEI